MEKRKKIGLLLLAVIGITVALIWGVRIQEMKNENTENLADEEKNDDLKGTTIASVILLEDQTEKVMQTAMRVTAEKYGATVIEGQSGGELERETRLLSDYMEQEVDAICIYPVSPTGSLAGLENAAKQGIDIYSVDLSMESKWLTGYCEANQYNIGQMVGKECAEYIRENFPDRKPKTAIIQFSALLPDTSKSRTRGFLSMTQSLIDVVQDVDTESQCIAIEMEPVKDYRPKPGVFIQKGEELLASVIACMKKVGEKIGDRKKNIAAISFTGQMSGFMGVDKDWNDITTWSCSLDSRYMPYAERQMKELKDEFLRVGGTNFPQMAPKVEWFRSEYPKESEKIAKYLMISGYVIGKLGDISTEDAVMDRSFTEWTGLADVQNDRWSDEICDAIHLDQKYLPRIVNSNHICAHLNKKMAAELGFTEGIPLVSGAGDKVAGCLGAGIVDYGDTIFEASSYGEVSTCVPEYRPDMEERRLDVLPSAIPGDFYATHFVAGSGITLDWFMNTFVKHEGITSKEMFAQMEEEMKNIPPGCDGLMAIGLLGGNSMPSDGALRGMWMGYDWSHSKAHFYKALIESFTYDFTLCMNSIERLYPEYTIDLVKIIGGGAKSPVWTQLSADIQNKKYTTINRDDVAMWGVSILAGNAIGVFGDLKETAKKFVSSKTIYTPDPENGKRYYKYMDLYKKYVTELHDFYKRIQDLANE